MTAQQYWNSEGVRFLAENNAVPTIEERVKAGFDAGFVDGSVENSIATQKGIRTASRQIALALASLNPSRCGEEAVSLITEQMSEIIVKSVALHQKLEITRTI